MHNLNTTEISKVGALLADSARTAIIIALCEETALPAGELAERASISPSTTSIHLARLMDAGWISLEQHGRHHYYRLASPQLKQLLKQAMSAAPHASHNSQHIAKIQQTPLSAQHPAQFPQTPASPQRTQHPHDSLRLARTCYDHLAGKLGVSLTDALLKQDALEVSEKDFKLTAKGSILLQNLGVDVTTASKQRRAFAHRCLDWTERRDHLGGALGAAICAKWLEQGWVQRQDNSRALLITSTGEAQLPTWGITTS
jgi:DNA-binding transcriptional ArsR family regulator